MSTEGDITKKHLFAKYGKQFITQQRVVNKLKVFKCEQPNADFMVDCFKHASEKEMIHIPTEEIEEFKTNNKTDYVYLKQVDDVWKCFSSNTTMNDKTLEDIKNMYNELLVNKKYQISPKGQAGGVGSDECKALIATMAVIGAATGALMGAFALGFGAGIGAGIGAIGGTYLGANMCSPTDALNANSFAPLNGGSSAKNMKSTGLKIKVPGFGLKTIYTPHGKKTKYIKFMDLQNNGERTPRYEPLKK